tara:strand:+ start:375 stop:935 length:561 start_codon:yes stop_codon:yes gene_type:complete
MSFYSTDELRKLGFYSVGSNVRISRKASFYGIERISIGSNVRIDDFCVLSAGLGGITIGNYIHIAVYSSLIGAGKIILSDFCNISSRVAIYSSNDDYSGEYMTNPMVPSVLTNISSDDVNIGKHVIIGSNSIILPGVHLGEGVAIGALSLVTKSIESYKVAAGTPAKVIKDRATNIRVLEESLQRQ